MAPLQPSTATSKSADFEGAENASEALLAHSRAAAAVYHSAFSAFCMSTTPEEFEAAMNTLEAAQVAEQEARLADMGRMAAITARCECILEQNPQPDAWWAQRSARARLSEHEAVHARGAERVRASHTCCMRGC